MILRIINQLIFQKNSKQKLLKNWMIKTLGLRLVKKEKQPVFYFFGLAEHAEAFRQMMQKKGLSCECVMATEQLMSDGHLTLFEQLRPQKPTVVVYDTAAYSYAGILRIFAKKPEEQVEVGIYHPEKQLLITEREIIE